MSAQSSAPLTLGLVGAIILCALLLRIFPDLQTVFFLVPGHAVTRPWMVLTAGYFEDSGIGLGAGLAALFGCGALLHDAWGGERELVRYVLLSNAAQGCCSWVGMISLYILFREEHFLFARLGGLSGMLGALAVAVKQQSLRRGLGGAAALPLPAGLAADPASPVPLLLEVAMRHAPSVALVWTAALLLVTHAGPPDELLFALNGTFVGWLYLRFFQPKADGACGDASAGFAFAELFPPPLQPPLRVLGAASFVLASSCGVFPPSGWGIHEGGGGGGGPLLGAVDVDVGGGASVLATPGAVGGGGGGGSGLGTLAATLGGGTPLPPAPSVTTSDPQVAERRRERARALIEARLAARATPGGGAAEPGEPQPAASAALLSTPLPPAAGEDHAAAAAVTPATLPTQPWGAEGQAEAV